MKRYLSVFVFSCCVAQGTCLAQQEPNFSHFSFFWLQYNPAFIGREENADPGSRGKGQGFRRSNEDQFANVALLARSQWTSQKGAPVSQGFAGTYPLHGHRMVLGVAAENSKLGASNLTSLKGNYSYRIHFDEKEFVSLGGSLGVVQYQMDGSELVLKDNIENDPSFYDRVKTVYVPDVVLGIGLKIRLLRLGLSVPHVSQSRLGYDKQTVIDPVGAERQGSSRLFRHYYLTGHYVIRGDHHLDIEPSFLIKYVRGAPPQADLSLNWVVGKGPTRYWIGTAYSTGNSVSALAGLCLNPGDKRKHHIYRIGYAYELSTSRFNAGRSSHELFLSFSFRTKNDEIY